VDPENRRENILVMDDDPEMQIFLANLLNSGGYRAVIADQDKDGLRQIAATSPLAIILCMMKYRDRKRELYRSLKTDPQLKHIPVIMLSNVERRTFFHYQKFKKQPVGASLPEPEAYFVKPLEADDLLRSIHRLTRQAPTGNTEGYPS